MVAESRSSLGKSRGILFGAPMVRALLNTRIGEPGPIDPGLPYKARTRRLSQQWLKVKAGDLLWVRENGRPWAWREDGPITVQFQADGSKMPDRYDPWSMSGDYESIIGMQRDEPIGRFLRGYPQSRFEPADGAGTLSGVAVQTDDITGLAIYIAPVRIGPILTPTSPPNWK